MPIDEDAVRSDLRAHGYSYVDDVGESFDLRTGFGFLGEPVPQYLGEYVRDVRPDPAISDDVITPYNRSEVLPHTEWFEFPDVPPRYVVLHAVVAASSGGETTLADGYGYLATFSAEDRAELARRSYRWRSQVTLESEGIHQEASAPILTAVDGRPVLRFSSLFMECADDFSKNFVAAGREYFRRTRVAIPIGSGGALVWDNWRMLHARNAFTDRRRHLRRVIIGAA
ncbi:TauD/TfdA dioxygenase family protein [Saccharothrix syringae]|uniref:TauD/TfdA dioxygenase family protein n=1 Tax=Saccharothrix syringae TaxID=103733 RepID=UPI0005246649|nr:TauD/TfdA family dioxygenase [Saccharothrix syringae]